MQFFCYEQWLRGVYEIAKFSAWSERSSSDNVIGEISSLQHSER